MAVQEKTLERNRESRTNPDIERIYHEWDSALSKNDMAAILAFMLPMRNYKARWCAT